MLVRTPSNTPPPKVVRSLKEVKPVSSDSPSDSSSLAGTSNEESEVPEDSQWERKQRRQRYVPSDYRMEDQYRRHTLQPSDPFSSSDSDPDKNTWGERRIGRSKKATKRTHHSYTPRRREMEAPTFDGTDCHGFSDPI